MISEILYYSDFYKIKFDECETEMNVFHRIVQSLKSFATLQKMLNVLFF